MGKDVTRPLLRFYFSFNDPYSFLMMPAVKQLGHDFKIDIDYLPLTQFDEAGFFSRDEKVASYWRIDAARFALKADRTLKYLNKKCDATAVVRAKYFADEQMLGFKYINLLFAHRWVSEGDISDNEAIITALRFLEMDEKKLASLLEGEENDGYESKINETIALAHHEGVLGVPFLTFEGEGYWGADRLDYLIEKLESNPALTVHHDASYGVIKADELAKKREAGDDDLILDLRIPKDFAAGHIPKANCLTAKIVHRNLNRLDRDATIILVDDGGVTASEIGFFMAGEGFKNIYTLVDGFPAWKGPIAEGLDNWHDRLKPLSR